MRTWYSQKKEITGSKKNNIARKQGIMKEKKIIAPIVHSESEHEPGSDPKSKSEESEHKYEHIGHNRHFTEKYDTTKYVTKKNAHWMDIFSKMMDNNIDPGPKE